MKLRRSQLCACVIILSLVGFPLVAGLSPILGIQNSLLSISMRAFVSFISLSLIFLWATRPHIPSGLACALLVILTLYGLRLAEQTLFRPESLGKAVSDYWIWFLGVTLLPVLSISATPNIDWMAVQRLGLILFTIAGAMAASQGSAIVEYGDEIFDTGRVALTSLNAISLGNIGVGLSLLSLWSLFGNTIPGWRRRSVEVLMVLFGFYLVLISASRGPLLSLFLTIIFFIVCLRGKRQIGFIVLFTVFVGAALFLFSNNFLGDGHYFSRLASLAYDFESDGSNIARRDLYTTSLKQVLDHPVLGSSLENDSFRYDPHNLMIELTLALGFPYSIFCFTVLASLVSRSARIVRNRHPLGGVALLFVSSLIGAQFSGNVYQGGAFWVTAMSIAATSRWNINLVSKATNGEWVARSAMPR